MLPCCGRFRLFRRPGLKRGDQGIATLLASSFESPFGVYRKQAETSHRAKRSLILLQVRKCRLLAIIALFPKCVSATW